ncbi:ABC transporter ATP-binding protein [Acrocarpospora macrocephala]|uniref:ABC transporter ATP-binding protein n=1 Tax=Acrocarpospora macrocephala TaxID=150177 RepID=A0A5M3WZ32_9ACTN|nr:ATP-binding cassette domain-containing protein [Acrocarpospora macrocephala]GES13676.1 ABC transporter ATP-binding protein [Acrocarpospora macrocephala]
MPTTAVRTINLTQGYGETPIIKNLTLDIPHGVFGLLGPNGAGKTTLLRTLATAIAPRSGEIVLLDRTVKNDRDAREVRRHLGYLPQEFGYHPNFTVHEFISYCAWLRRIPSALTREVVTEAIMAVDLGAQAKTKMKNLSGGMLRRAGIAQAILGGTRLVLLDEPTVGLDPEQRLAFRDLIRKVSGRATVVLSTHLVEDVAAVCDNLLIIADGEPVFTGSPRELRDLSSEGARGDTELERGYTAALHRDKAGI